MSNPLVAGPVDTATPFSGAGILDSGTQLAEAIKSGDWVMGGLAAFSTAADTVATVSDPLGSLLGAGLGWLMDHMEPLKGWMNDLTGDAGEVAGFAQTWANVQTQLDGAAQHLDHVVGDLDEMAGQAIEAYRRFQTDAAQHIHAAGQWAGAMATGLEIASTIVQVVHDLVRDVLSQLVGSAISWAAEAVFTLGLATPWIIEQVSTRVASLAAKVGSKVTAVLQSCKSLMKLLDELKALMRNAGNLFDSVLKGGRNAPATPRGADAPHTPRAPDDGVPRDPADAPGDGPDAHGDAPDIDPADYENLRYYTGPGYDEINRALRGEIPMTPELRTRIDNAVEEMQRLPDYTGVVRRGENLPEGATWLDDYQPGTVVDRPAFTSTSVDNPFSGNVSYEITSTHGKRIDELSYYPTESEVLFPPGARFEVISRTDEGGHIHIVMKEVD